MNSCAGMGRSSPTQVASRSFRWVTALSPMRSRVAPRVARSVPARCWESKRMALAIAPTSMGQRASWVLRTRCKFKPTLAPTSHWFSMSAHHSTSSVSTPLVQPSARTAGSTVASAGTLRTAQPVSSSTASCKAASTRIYAAIQLSRLLLASVTESRSVDRSVRTRSRCTKWSVGRPIHFRRPLTCALVTYWESARSTT